MSDIEIKSLLQQFPSTPFIVYPNNTMEILDFSDFEYSNTLLELDSNLTYYLQEYLNDECESIGNFHSAVRYWQNYRIFYCLKSSFDENFYDLRYQLLLAINKQHMETYEKLIPNNSPVLIMTNEQIYALKHIYLDQRHEINYRRLVANWASRTLWHYNSTLYYSKVHKYDKEIPQVIKDFKVENMTFNNFENWKKDLLFARCIFPLIKKLPTIKINISNVTNHFKYKSTILNLLISQELNKYIAQYLFEFIEYENNKKKFGTCLLVLKFKYSEYIMKLKSIKLRSIYENFEYDCITQY